MRNQSGANLVMLIMMCLATLGAAQEGESVFPDPGLANPKLRFSTGGVANNLPEISSILPAIPGSPSAWYVAQWHHDVRLQPTDLRTRDPSVTDPLFGIADYSFDASDAMSHLHIFRNHATGGYVFDLSEQGGALQAGGGSTTFLAARAILPNATLDRPIIYELDAKVTRASIRYDSDLARASGAVLGNLGSGFTMQYTAGGPAHVLTVFDQLPISSARLRPTTYRECDVGRNGSHVFTVDHVASPENFLPFSADRGPLHHLRYDLQSEIRFVLAQDYNCKNLLTGDRQAFRFPPEAADLSKWRIVSMYVGMEAENRDLRSSSHNREPQGDVDIGLQVANLRVIRPN